MRKGKIYQPYFTILVNSERKKGQSGGAAFIQYAFQLTLQVDLEQKDRNE